MLKKIYSVTFRDSYRGVDTVSDGGEVGNMRILHIGKTPYLVTEDDVSLLKEFGGGIDTLKFVGCMDSEEIAKFRNKPAEPLNS